MKKIWIGLIIILLVILIQFNFVKKGNASQINASIQNKNINNVQAVTIPAKEIEINKNPIDQIIFSAAYNNNLPEKYVKAVVKAESDYRINCVGPDTQFGNAYGLMQLLPATAKQFGVTDIFDPTQNINAGTKYLKELVDKYSNKDYFDQNGVIVSPYELAAIAYNWGCDNLDKHINKNGCIINNGKNSIPNETYNYVIKIKQDFDFSQYFD